MPTVEVSRTLVKSPPELWSELSGERLREAVGGAALTVTEEERRIEWEADDANGAAVLEPAGWGTKLTLTATVEQEVARLEPDVARMGLWARLIGVRPPAPPVPAAPPADGAAAKICRRRSSSCSTTWAPPTAGRSRTADRFASVSRAVTAVPDHTTRRGFLGAGASAAALGLGAAGAARAADRPNVVVIVVDTLRADHVYGDRARTPNMDALRREGISFTSAYPEALPTVPVRNTLLSGRRNFPFRGWHDWRGLLDSPGWEPLHARAVVLDLGAAPRRLLHRVCDRQPVPRVLDSLPAAEGQLPPLRAHRRTDRRPADRGVASRAAPLDAPRAASRREGVRAHAPLPRRTAGTRTTRHTRSPPGCSPTAP